MAVGRPPKSNVLKMMQGTAEKSRMPIQEPEIIPAEDISPPKRMVDGIALETWQLAAPLLRDAKILTEGDKKCLEGYCYAYANMIRAQQDIEDNGLVLTQKNGREIRNPASACWKDSMAEMRYYSQQLGLDPASRGRLDIGKQKPKGNPFTDL